MKRILIVDDDVSFTRLLKLNLEQTGAYEVRIENWPEDALKSARESKPDLILLDVMMPRLFGGDVATRIRNDAELKSTPIVFLTAAVKKHRVEEHEGTISGYPFLAKPASTQEVIACIEQHARPSEKVPSTPGIKTVG
jgi:two-component system, OmpR family, alkaline phosphatase synthesis response regulator PhoP